MPPRGSNPPIPPKTTLQKGLYTMENEKTYTEQEVAALINAKLADYKKEADAKFAEREKALKQKEFEYSATQLLKSKNLPDSMIKFLKGDDMDNFSASVEAVAAYIDYTIKQQIQTHREGIDSGVKPGYYDSPQYTNNNGIRDAMGLR